MEHSPPNINKSVKGIHLTSIEEGNFTNSVDVEKSLRNISKHITQSDMDLTVYCTECKPHNATRIEKIDKHADLECKCCSAELTKRCIFIILQQ